MLRAILTSLVLVAQPQLVHGFLVAQPHGLLTTRAMKRTPSAVRIGMAVDDATSAVYDNPSLAAQRKELELVAAELATVAEKFSPEVASFAKKWASKLIETGTVASSAEFVLIDECLVDDPKCEELEDAIKKLQGLAGSDWAGTAC